MLNKIVLMGRLAAHPELRYTQKKTPVASFTLAVERDYQSGAAERQTDFISCVAWDKTAEFVSRYFQKGQLMVVSGRLQSRKWRDNEGSNRVRWEVIAENVYFSGDRKIASQVHGHSVEVDKPPFWNLDEDDTELPF